MAILKNNHASMHASILTMHALPQVDGTYEDWVEVLLILYHAGGSWPSRHI